MSTKQTSAAASNSPLHSPALANFILLLPLPVCQLSQATTGLHHGAAEALAMATSQKEEKRKKPAAGWLFKPIYKWEMADKRDSLEEAPPSLIETNYGAYIPGNYRGSGIGCFEGSGMDTRRKGTRKRIWS